MALIHGGDTAGFRMEYGYEPLDFSANCNPLGVPEGVKRAISLAALQLDVYPDPLCRSLRAALSDHEGVRAEYILCGNGSADLIDRLAYARSPGIAVITDPSFSEYERALRNTNCRIIHHPLNREDGFALTESILAQLTPEVDMLFLCNPNNPTGLTIRQQLLEEILDACVKSNILLVLDECFNGFLDDPELYTLLPRINHCPNILILKAFTKLYGMAGVRLGYCLSSDTGLLEAMQKAGQPWAVSSLAQAAGVAALDEEDYVRTSRMIVHRERLYLSVALDSLGLFVANSEANYLFFYIDIPDLAIRMREKGILIRDCSNYPGLHAGYYRIAVRTHKENVRLISAITAFVKESPNG